MMRALFGGTFDPIHAGHLKTVSALIDEIGIDVLHLMPNAVPPHRSQPQATAAQRLAMVELACESHPKLQAEAFELQSKQPSYTIKTLKHFRHTYADDTLLFVMGMDSLVSLDRWFQWSQLADYAHLLIMPRPGYQLADASEPLKDYLRKHIVSDSQLLREQPQGSIYIADTPLINISATQIRQQLANNNMSHVLTDSVFDFIHQQGLYGTHSSPQG